MRHVLLLSAPATGTRGMVHAPAAALLIAPAGGALRVAPRLLSTAALAVDLAAVAATADEHLSAAADAQKQPAERSLGFRFARAWTTSAMGGILPRHACSARCGARRRSGLGGLGRRRACQSGRVSLRQCALDRAAALRSRGRRAQTCGYVDNAKALPTNPQVQQQQSASHLMTGSNRHRRLACHVQTAHAPTACNIVTSRMRHLCADPDSHRHS
jgi:hypothetical protein